MQRRLIAVVALVVARAGRKVEGTGDLFVEERVLHDLGHIGIHAQRKFADIARARVDVEHSVDALGIVGRRLDDFAVLKRQANVLKREALVQGRRVVAQRAVDAVPDRRGEYLAVGDIAIARALDRRQAPDREGQIGARPHDMHAVSTLHALNQRIHRAGHLFIVQTAHLEIVVLERLGGHSGQLRHGGRGPAQHRPARMTHAQIAVHLAPVAHHVQALLFRGHIAHLKAVHAAADADIGVHLRHQRRVAVRPQIGLLPAQPPEQRARHRRIAQPDIGARARGIHLVDQRGRHGAVHAGHLEQHVFIGLHSAGVGHQAVRQRLDSRISHWKKPSFHMIRARFR